MHQQSLDIFQKYAVPLFKSGMKVLELGPDAVPSAYLELIRAADLTVDWYFTTFDDFGAHIPPELISKRVHMLSLYQIDAEAESYDVVFSGQVLEHVPAPWRWFPETVRVLKPGGRVVVIAPAEFGYHAHPIDCWRVWPDGLRALFEESKIVVDFIDFLEQPRSQNVDIFLGNEVTDTIAIGTKL